MNEGKKMNVSNKLSGRVVLGMRHSVVSNSLKMFLFCFFPFHFVNLMEHSSPSNSLSPYN